MADTAHASSPTGRLLSDFRSASMDVQIAFINFRQHPGADTEAALTAARHRLAAADAALAPERDPKTLTVAVERIRDRLAPIGRPA